MNKKKKQIQLLLLIGICIAYVSASVIPDAVFVDPTTLLFIENGTSFDLMLLKDPNSTDILEAGNVILFNPSSSTILPNDEHQVKAELISVVNDGSFPVFVTLQSGNTVSYPAGSYEIWTLSMISAGVISNIGIEYNWAIEFDFNDNFKNIFPRFSYRYKYIDGEYSSYAPFTTVAFEPKDFLYDVKEAYNKGMENNISRLLLVITTITYQKTLSL